MADAVCDYTRQSSQNHQEFGDVLRDVKRARQTCAQLIGAHPDEIALLGPTSLGLSLFANGLDWQPGDEVVCYHGDYPANVYPWLELRRRGITVRYLEPAAPGAITPDLVARALTRARNSSPSPARIFLRLPHRRGRHRRAAPCARCALSLDAIQTLGAFRSMWKRPTSISSAPTPTNGCSARSPSASSMCAARISSGCAHLARRVECGRAELQRPGRHRLVPTAQRYEPGVLNIAGILGMKAALDFLLATGLDAVAARLLELKAHLVRQLDALGFTIHGPRDGANASSTTTFRHATASSTALFPALEKAHIVASLRHDREGRDYLRFSPHFYNTEAELDRAVEVLRAALA